MYATRGDLWHATPISNDNNKLFDLTFFPSVPSLLIRFSLTCPDMTSHVMDLSVIEQAASSIEDEGPFVQICESASTAKTDFLHQNFFRGCKWFVYHFN